jgi:hypothetical protein
LRKLGSSLSKDHSDRYFNGRMGETQEKGKKYDLTLSCRFNVVEFIRRRLSQETVGRVGKLIPVEIVGK